MLISKLLKKFPSSDPKVKNTIESEVKLFCSSEYVTKETMKMLEQRISRKLLSDKEVDRNVLETTDAYMSHRGLSQNRTLNNSLL